MSHVPLRTFLKPKVLGESPTLQRSAEAQAPAEHRPVAASWNANVFVEDSRTLQCSEASSGACRALGFGYELGPVATSSGSQARAYQEPRCQAHAGLNTALRAAMSTRCHTSAQGSRLCDASGVPQTPPPHLPALVVAHDVAAAAQQSVEVASRAEVAAPGARAPQCHNTEAARVSVVGPWRPRRRALGCGECCAAKRTVSRLIPVRPATPS